MQLCRREQPVSTGLALSRASSLAVKNRYFCSISWLPFSPFRYIFPLALCHVTDNASLSKFYFPPLGDHQHTFSAVFASISACLRETYNRAKYLKICTN